MLSIANGRNAKLNELVIRLAENSRKKTKINKNARQETQEHKHNAPAESHCYEEWVALGWTSGNTLFSL